MVQALGYLLYSFDILDQETHDKFKRFHPFASNYLRNVGIKISWSYPFGCWRQSYLENSLHCVLYTILHESSCCLSSSKTGHLWMMVYLHLCTLGNSGDVLQRFAKKCCKPLAAATELVVSGNNNSLKLDFLNPSEKQICIAKHVMFQLRLRSNTSFFKHYTIKTYGFKENFFLCILSIVFCVT